MRVCIQVIPVTNLGMVKQLCSLVDAFIPLSHPDPDSTAASTTTANSDKSVLSLTWDKNTIEQLYILSIIWSIGGSLLESSRTIFADYVQSLFTSGISGQDDRQISGSALVPANNGRYYDYFYDVSNGVWTAWSSVVPSYSEPVPFKFYSVMVPTTDSVLYR